MDKLFDEWNQVKQRVNAKIHQPPFVSEGDIWWLNIGKNIGSEINGKSLQFSRPAVILKKLSHGFYLVAPTTTKVKSGSWYVSIHHKGIDMFICLHQIRTIDFRRLFSKLGTLEENEKQSVRFGFAKLYV